MPLQIQPVPVRNIVNRKPCCVFGRWRPGIVTALGAAIAIWSLAPRPGVAQPSRATLPPASLPSLMHDPTDPRPTPPAEAIALLKAGNARFLSGKALHPHCDARKLAELACAGQHPFAAIVSCSDSRVPVELIFDQGAGDLFVIRVAGNVCATDETGSIEYAVEHLGMQLVLVLGHRQCGAVQAVLRHSHEADNLSALISHIQPAVAEALAGHPGADESELLDAAIEANVRQSILEMLQHSGEVRRLIRERRLAIEGAVYDLSGGGIKWMGPHRDQSRLIAESAR